MQLDGSQHDWFEGRAAQCCLLGFIDDATSRLLWAEFVSSESTDSLLLATTHYLEKEGRPISIYTDRGGVYKVNIHNTEDNKVTQYERALRELEITLIHARSPQAKGRIERVFGTLQDRLVKELRLKGMTTTAEANRYLQEEYLALHNAKFSHLPKEKADLHRSLDGFDLHHILCVKETRILQADWCLSYHNRFLQLEKRQLIILTKGEVVMVSHYRDGSLHLSVRGTALVFRELIERSPKPRPEKVLDPNRPSYKPAPNHPWKQFRGRTVTNKSDISKWLEPDISILV